MRFDAGDCYAGGVDMRKQISVERKQISVEEALAIFRKTQPDFQLPVAVPVEQPKAEPKQIRKKTLPAKVKQFKQAVVDLASGNVVSLPVFQQRLAICERNECGYLIKANKGWFLKAAEALGKEPVDQPLFCNACGCGSTNPLAELHTKLWAPDIECPLEQPLWGKETPA
jgi:hypothetical protein